jgi:hypothetical protein
MAGRRVVDGFDLKAPLNAGIREIDVRSIHTVPERGSAGYQKLVYALLCRVFIHSSPACA